jgi:glutaredoxin-related protein
MTRIIFFIVLFFCGGIHGVAQTDTSFRLIGAIRGDIVAFTVDNLDNIYILGSTNQVKKLNANGDSMAVFNDVKKYGQAGLIDVSNPLKVLLYYQDFATVVALDRLLNVRNTIQLRKHGIQQVRAVAQSYDNKIWLYDEMESKLKKIDEDGQLLQETPDFRQLFGQAPVPQKIFDQDQLVYVYDSTQAVFVFDYYGTLRNKILIRGWQNFKVAGKYIFGSADNRLYRYDIRTFQTDEWDMPEELLKSRAFNFTASRLYALKEDVIEIYSFR